MSEQAFSFKEFSLTSADLIPSDDLDEDDLPSEADERTARYARLGKLVDVQPSPGHPILWWGTKPTVSGKYPLDQHPEPHGASSRALKAWESTYVNPTGYITPTRSASFRTEVNNALTWFARKAHQETRQRAHTLSWPDPSATL
jgi:hypothetical protein